MSEPVPFRKPTDAELFVGDVFEQLQAFAESEAEMGDMRQKLAGLIRALDEEREYGKRMVEAMKQTAWEAGYEHGFKIGLRSSRALERTAARLKAKAR